MEKIVVNEETMAWIEAQLDRPPVYKPKLAALLNEPTPFANNEGDAS